MHYKLQRFGLNLLAVEQNGLKRLLIINIVSVQVLRVLSSCCIPLKIRFSSLFFFMFSQQKFLKPIRITPNKN